MSRRAPIIEDVFEDDTDLPLPNVPLPNTGASGPLIEELNIEYDPLPSGGSYSNSTAGQPMPSPSHIPQFQQQQGMKNTVTDITPYKKWSCIYPIYIDAKRPYGPGMRRLPRQKSVWWPLSKDIADAASRLGLKALHEVQKSHPRDWENPGRVRIQWKVDGKLVLPGIKTKRQLLEMISMYIQVVKPDNRPVPPYTTSASPPSPEPSLTQPQVQFASVKGKEPQSKALGLSKGKSSSSSAPNIGNEKQKQNKSRRSTPAAPHPLPPISERISPYSPALESGVLIDTVKAGMAAQEGQAADGGAGAGAVGGPGQGGGGGMQKGKRKVVRVRQ